MVRERCTPAPRQQWLRGPQQGRGKLTLGSYWASRTHRPAFAQHRLQLLKRQTFPVSQDAHVTRCKRNSLQGRQLESYTPTLYHAHLWVQGSGVGGRFSVPSAVFCDSLFTCNEHVLVLDQKQRESQGLRLDRKRLTGRRPTEEWQRYLVISQLQRGHGLHVQKEVGFGLGGLAFLLVLRIQLHTVDDQAPEEVQEELQEGRPCTSAQL